MTSVMYDAAGWQVLDPQWLHDNGAAAGVYSGNGLPDQWWFDACDALNVPILGIQESTAGRALEGYQAGYDDAQFAAARFASRGRGPDFPIAFVVSDNDRFTPSSGGERIADYGQGSAVPIPNPTTFYGNRYAVDAALTGAQRVTNHRLIVPNGGWLPRPWDADESRDLIIQEANTPSPLAGADLDTVLIDFFGGDMFTDADRALLEEVRNALRGPNGGGDGGDVQTQVGQTWATMVGSDPAHPTLLTSIDAIVAKHAGGTAESGPTDAQVQALVLMRQAQAAFTAAFPS